MADIVERLRRRDEERDNSLGGAVIMPADELALEAADDITRLRAQLAVSEADNVRLREAAAAFEDDLSTDCDGPKRDALRQALAATERLEGLCVVPRETLLILLEITHQAYHVSDSSEHRVADDEVVVFVPDWMDLQKALDATGEEEDLHEWIQGVKVRAMLAASEGGSDAG